MASDGLARYGWSQEWSRLWAESARKPGLIDSKPGRVMRHDGVAVTVVTDEGPRSLPLRRGLRVPPVVGDWVAVDGDRLVAVLPRRSLLERRAARSDTRHPLVANVDQVLITCGIDRPLSAGRIQRSATVAWEAGATPTIVLTKTDLGDEEVAPGVDRRRLADDLAAAHAGLEVVSTSSLTGAGLDELRARIGRHTAVLLGESGSGKSSLVNALCGEAVATTGEVRARDRKGRHTTTVRELHPLPGGGVVVDTPGLRSLGLWVETSAVDTTFEDVAELAAGCRFRDCAHQAEPGCQVQAAIADGRLEPERLAAFRRLTEEAAEVEERRAR